tara:strand:+ start:70 stop:720 length:651 start_codon:yes stop_codon:yes gene_type:complete
MYLKKFDKFLLMLLGIDIIFILLSLIDSFSGFNFSNFAVQNDNLFAEKFQYLKFIGIAIICFLLAIKSRSLKFLFFMNIPIYLYLDDSRQLHERFGTKIASFLHDGNSNDTLITNFRYQDFGELLYMLFFAFIILFIFLICYELSNTFERHFLKKILKLFIIFGIFAILVDSMHQLSNGFIYKLLTIIEDGGEMIPLSFITAYFFKYLINNKNKYT